MFPNLGGGGLSNSPVYCKKSLKLNTVCFFYIVLYIFLHILGEV